jgi:hypothetical protein
MTAAETESPPPAHAGVRRWTMRGLVTLASILLVIGSLAIWIERVVLEPATWSDTSGRVLDDPEVRAAVSTYLVDQLYTSGDITTRVASALPDRAKPLAGPATAAMREPLERATNRALASPVLQDLWRAANLRADQRLVTLLEGGAQTQAANGAVVLDLSPLLERISNRGTAGAAAVDSLPPGAGQVTILESDQLATAQDIAQLLRTIANLLVALVLVLFAAAIVVATDRRRALRACSIGLLASGVVLILFRRVLGDELVSRLVSADSMRPAARAVWLIATAPIGLGVVSILFVGLVGLMGAWLVGPSDRAARARVFLAPYLLRGGLSFGLLAAVLVLLLAWGPTPAARNWVTVLALGTLAFVGLELLRRTTALTVDTGGAVATGGAAGATSVGRRARGDDGRIDRLERLADLRTRGLLTDEEFAEAKEHLLGDSRATPAGEAGTASP